jgi:hypothetical protein
MAPETIEFDLIFQKAVHAIQKLCDKASLKENSKMILTEADLQSWIFCYLQRFLADDLEVDGATDKGCSGVHCHPSVKDENQQLRIKPDIVIFAKSEYSVSPSSDDDLLIRKGFYSWGTSILMELKILRTSYNIETEFRKWKKDINKLGSIITLHYSDPSVRALPLFVLFCRKELSDNQIDKLARYASLKSINLIISIVGRESSFYGDRFLQKT